jgi:hypothetical protein
MPDYAGPGPEAVPAYVYPAVCVPVLYGSGTSPGVIPAPTPALADLPAHRTHGAGRSAGWSDLRRRILPVFGNPAYGRRSVLSAGFPGRQYQKIVNYKYLIILTTSILYLILY